ncbi:MAG: serpin-like protein [Elusimicrobia bacterium]|nr:MAG: serpin-like protein [Elusimicrobiota bacterium]KAF0156483.1 MAG: serpin-like protein [Elusimicrobiota bacterium]
MISNKIVMAVVFLTVFAAFACAGKVAEDKKAGAAAAAPAVPALAPYNNDFAIKLYRSLAPENGNIFFSPYSITSAFAMTREGAKGPTADEFTQVFGFPAPAKGLAESFEAAAGALEAGKGTAKLTLANSIWPQRGYKFKAEYLSKLKKSYGAQSSVVDFSKDAEAARKEINDWTGKKTEGKIKDLFPPKSLTALTRLVLASAVYFKGTWQHPFEAGMTSDADFFVKAGEPVKVKMMAHPGQKKRLYTADDLASVVDLPYAGGSLSMMAVLPREGKSLAEVEEVLSAKKLADWREAMDLRDVKAFLPRFKFSAKYSLAERLPAMGLKLAFTDAADFSGMDGTQDLYIQKAFHQAFVEVNEEGTEAAAATGVAMGLKSIQMDFELFRADRPFLFLILENKTGLVLFIGRVENPAA